MGFDFGPYLVHDVASMGGGEAKVSSSLNLGLLQYYLAPFSKAAK